MAERGNTGTTARPGSEVTRGHGALASYFLGPKAQNAELWREMLARVYDDYVYWRRNYFPEDKSIITRADQRDRLQEEWLDDLSSHLDRILDKLKADYPFYSPRYLAHMTSDQTLPGILGLFAGILYNPNNVTREVAAVTVGLELEVGDLLADMLGFARDPRDTDEDPWGHLTSGGTIATLEALWVARQAQFVPLIVAHICRSERERREAAKRLEKRGCELSPVVTWTLDSELWGAFLENRDLDRAPSELLNLEPEAQLKMLRDLRGHLASDISGRPPGTTDGERQLSDLLLDAVSRSPYNPACRGYAAVLAEINKTSKPAIRTGVVFGPETAHYCLAKACNVLGYGSEALKLVPVDDHFRMRVSTLNEEITNLKSDEYVAAVVGVLGTTEEGAVDPLHEIVAERERRGKRSSFWIHADAAWGGYIACVFDRGADRQLRRTSDGELSIGHEAAVKGHVARAFGALRLCDSVVVDPHKLGYIPYPSGAVVFRDGRTRLLTAQTASYIGAGGAGGPDPLLAAPRDTFKSVGEYVLEGSKPGACATAAWLAHNAIPLTQEGHGQIIRETLLATQKLAILLTQHDRVAGADSKNGHDYTVGYRLVAQPDTNLVTFIAQPRRVRAHGTGELVDVRWPLADVNALNSGIHARMGVPRRSEEASAQQPADAVPPYGHPFFVSRTKMRSTAQPGGTYSFASVGSLLGDLLPAESDHENAYDACADGLVAIRCVVMNPFYGLAEQKGDDYLEEFVSTLHKVACRVLRSITEQLFAYALVQCSPGTATDVAKKIRSDTAVRRAVLLRGTTPDAPSKVLLELRQPLDADENPREALRRLGADYEHDGVEHTETLISTEGKLKGQPALDACPIVYVLLRTESGHTLKIRKKAMGLSIPTGGMECRIVTGPFDIVVSLSGMTEAAALPIVNRLMKFNRVQCSEALWSDEAASQATT
jgi:tyrosine decarboxylase